MIALLSDEKRRQSETETSHVNFPLEKWYAAGSAASVCVQRNLASFSCAWHFRAICSDSIWGSFWPEKLFVRNS
jgi:hypothetical protein